MSRSADDFWRTVEGAGRVDGDSPPRSLDLEQLSGYLLRCLAAGPETAPVGRVLRGGEDWPVAGMDDNVYPSYADPAAVRSAWAALGGLDRAVVADCLVPSVPIPEAEAWLRERVRLAWMFFRAAAEADEGIVRIAG